MLTSEQHEIRQRGIGGSDAPIICGISQRCTSLDLWHVKRGEIEPASVLQDEAWIGSEAETVIAKWFQRETGLQTRKVKDTQWHPDVPFMLAHPDRWVPKAGVGLEMKMRAFSADWGPSGSDQIPDDVRLQVTHYMEVCEVDHWWVAVWLPPFQLRTYRIPYDPQLARHLVTIERAWWESVQSGEEPPEPTWDHQTTTDLLGRMYPSTDGSTVDLGESGEAWTRVYIEAREQRQHYQRAEAAARNHILHLLEYGAVGVTESGTWRRTVTADGQLDRIYFKERTR